jgi:hypothetical protein
MCHTDLSILRVESTRKFLLRGILFFFETFKTIQNVDFF